MPKAWIETAHTQIYNVTEEARKQGTEHPQDDASLSVWLVHAPWMAPYGAWHWHYAGLVHLRDLPGQSRAPTLRSAEATHEFISMAVDPSGAQPNPEGVWVPLRFLSPMSIVQQFHAPNDADALRRVEWALQSVGRGALTLEDDGRAAWAHALNAPQH